MVRKKYNGFIIEYERYTADGNEKGYDYVTVRESDKWILSEGFVGGKLKDLEWEYKYIIDDYLNNPDMYED